MYIQNQFSCFLIGEGTLLIQCAELLLERGHQIFGVISPDASISSWAKAKDIPHIQQTENLIAFLRQQPFDYLFNIVNSSLLPKEILELPRQLAIDYHDAPLPKYAGLNATSWALMHRQKTHGVTWYVMSDSVEGGDILKQVAIDIADDDTAFTLNKKCYEAAIRSFEELVDEISSGQALAFKQNLDERTYLGHSKRLCAGGVLSFNRCAYDMDADIRALDFGSYPNPLGVAKLAIGSESIVIPKLEVKDDLSKSSPGTITAIEPSFLTVSTASYEVALRQVLTIDGQALSIPDFVERFGLQVGYQFKDIEPDRARRIERFDGLISQHEAFWVEKLATLQPIAVPYADRTASHLNQKQYTSVKMSIPDEVTTFLEGNPAWNQSDFLFAAFATYLARIGRTGCFDIGFRDVELQRELIGLEGFFASIVSCGVDIDCEQSFEEVFKAFEEQVELTKLHKTYARDVVTRYPALRSLPDHSREPIFPVVVQRVEKLDEHQTGFGNELTLVIPSQGKECGWLYNTEALDGDSIARMLDQFATFLQGIVTDPKGRVAEIPLLSDPDCHKILVEWNDTQADYPKDKCIHQLFEAQVEQTPDAVAVVYEDKQLTYRELNARANQLAHYLQKLGVGPEVLVAIFVERSLEMMVGLLGILKAGGAYVPLDPAYPFERLGFMLEDSSVPVLLSQSKLVEKLPPHSARLVNLDKDWEEIVQQSKDNPSSFTPDNLAYVIYTSGSTGKAKGVLIQHGSLVNYTTAASAEYRISECDRILQFASISFDASAEEIYPCLTSGATLVLRTDSMLDSLGGFLQMCRTWNLTVLSLPTAYWHELTAILSKETFALPPSLRLVIIGGEKALPKRWETWLEYVGQRVPLVNTYGPTEATVVATIYELSATNVTLRELPIGRPLGNVQTYILDRNGQPVPIGVPGELLIGGAGLARGYLNRPELTKDKFIPNPFSNEPGTRLYKTGDLARYLPDGNIEFLGRIDNQVKIRGFRIELGEVESTLSQYPTVLQCVVTARVDYESDKRLVAYIVSNQQQKPTTDELRCFLKQKLPDYMVPSAFVFLDTLPLTPNGKIDQRALPAPNELRPEPASTFVPPSDDLEIQLTKIWENVFGKKPISVKDNFFDVGGHSILAVRLLAQIEKAFGKNLPLATLFQSPTIEQLANILRQKGWSAPWQTLVPIQPGGSKPPLYFIHVLGEGLKYCRPLTSHLDPEQPIYGLTVEIMDEVSLNKVEDVVAHYIKEMRSIQPEGPYLLAGIYCGGRVAYDMAQQLHAQGQKVALLALLDSFKDGEAIKILSLKERALAHWNNLLRVGPAYLLNKRRLGNVKNRLMSFYCEFYERLGLPSPQACQSFTYRKKKEEGNIEWVFAPKDVYPERVTLFRPMESIGFIEDLGWSELAPGGLEIHDVPGDSDSILEEPHIQVLAEKLRDCIDRVQGGDLYHVRSINHY
jgi:amino acid adenylation domain-containing protein